MIKKEISPEQFQEFIKLLTYLKPWEIIGVAKILKIEVLKDEVDENGHHLPRDFVDVYEEMLDAFCAAGRKERKFIIEVLQNAKEQQHDDSGDK